MAVISRLERTLTANHTALVLFDALHGYLHPQDETKRRFLAEHKILANMQRLHAGARKAGLVTFYPMGAHAPDGSDWVERLTDTDMNLNPIGNNTIKIAITKDTEDFEVAEELKAAPGDVLIPKHRWSAFLHTDLEFHLRVRNLDTIVIAGGSTDVGIAATVFAARDLDLGIVVVRDACYAMRGPNHDFLMDRIFPRMSRVMTVDQAVALMLPQL